MSNTEALKPCPFCGAGLTSIRENGKMWTGQRYSEPTSVSVQHHCEPVAGQPSRMIERIGRDEASAIDAWNRRAALAQPAASGEPPRTLLEQYDREQLPGYCAGYEDGRQRGYIVGHRHGLEQAAAYATAQPARVPLTEEQISNMWSHECVRERLTRDLVQAFARAIEAAHGITAPGAPDAGPVQ